MNPLDPILSVEFIERVKTELKQLRKNHASPRVLSAIDTLNEFVQKYGQKNTVSMGLIVGHIGLGLSDYFSQSAREFKEDAAKLLTNLYLVLLEIRGITINSRDAKEIEKLSIKVIENIFSIKTKCDGIESTLNKTPSLDYKRSIITELLESELYSRQRIGDGVLLKALILFAEHGIIKRTRDGFDFNSLDYKLALTALEFENIFNITKLLKSIEDDNDSQLGPYGEYIKTAQKEGWPKVLQESYGSIRRLTSEGVNMLVLQGGCEQMLEIYNNYVSDPSCNAREKLKTYVIEAYDALNMSILKADNFDLNSVKKITDIYISLSSIKSGSFKEFMLSTYDEHLDKLLGCCVDLEKDVNKLAAIMQLILNNSRFAPHLAVSFNEKVLKMLFNKFERSHPNYNQKILVDLLEKNTDFFIKLYKESESDFFAKLIENGTFKYDDGNERPNKITRSSYYASATSNPAALSRGSSALKNVKNG